MRWTLILIALAGCGRLGFETIDAAFGSGDGSGMRDGAGDGGRPSTWNLVQTTNSVTNVIAFAPTGSGNLIVVAVQTSSSVTVSSISDNAPGGANTYAAVPGARSTDAASSAGLDFWFATSSRPGATTITTTVAGAPTVVAWEVSGPSFSVDGASVSNDQPASTTPSAATITSTVDGDFIVSAAIMVNQALGIHAGSEFTNDWTANDNGWAHVTSTGAPAGVHQARWDQNSAGTYCASSVAFKLGP